MTHPSWTRAKCVFFALSLILAMTGNSIGLSIVIVAAVLLGNRAETARQDWIVLSLKLRFMKGAKDYEAAIAAARIQERKHRIAEERVRALATQMTAATIQPHDDSPDKSHLN